MTVEISGPLFDGRAARALQQAENATAGRATQHALDLLRTTIQSEAAHYTGSYISRLQVHRIATTVLITDLGVRYGPWLEGSSARNNATRFKGHHAFRRTAQEMTSSNVVSDIFEEELQQRMGEMQ